MYSNGIGGEESLPIHLSANLRCERRLYLIAQENMKYFYGKEFRELFFVNDSTQILPSSLGSEPIFSRNFKGLLSDGMFHNVEAEGSMINDQTQL